MVLNRNLFLALFLCLLGFAPITEACHLAGGNITYVNIGPNQYRLRLTLIRSCICATTVGSTVNIGYRNNCGVTGTTQLSLLPGSGGEIPTPCTDEPSTCAGGNRYGVQKYELEGVVTLPVAAATCQEWIFSYGVCCRNNSNTLVAQPQFYVESMVNNAAGINNSSAVFNTFQVPVFCILEPVNVLFNVDEPDGDSLVFALTPARISAVANAPYQPGFSAAQPVNGTPPVVNQNNGNISFISTASQESVIVLTVTEYRNGIVVGRVSFDVQLVLGTGRYCDNITPSFMNDSLARACTNDLNLSIRLNTLIQCNTISSDASEFRLYYPDGRLVPIVSASAINCVDGRTRDILLTLARPMNLNGFYHLTSRKGIDGDTFGNQCQRFMVEFDSMVFMVSGCPDYTIPFTLLNVSVDSINQNAVDVSWSDPQSLNYNWFSAFLIWRENAISGNFDRIQHTENNPAARFFKDVEPEVLPKDKSIAYRANLVLTNGARNPYSNELRTIRLVANPPDDADKQEISLNWSPYTGWSNPVYFVQFKDEQRDFPVGWQFPESGASTMDTFITIKKAILPGNYLARVITIDGGSGRKSYSNWVNYSVKARDIKIPNAVSPNGDGVNDLFVVENLEYYLNGHLKIFNRWGQLVYEATRYLNNWNAANLEGGTYFYQLTVQKDQTETAEYKGAVEVVK